MARRQTKTFQQRQTEQRQREQQDRELFEGTAAKFSCSNEIARDFAEQCELRIADLAFDLRCNDVALDFWAAPPDSSQPVVELLRELADERRRHSEVLAKLRDRFRALTGPDIPHHHLSLSCEHYAQQVQQRIFSD